MLFLLILFVAAAPNPDMDSFLAIKPQSATCKQIGKQAKKFKTITNKNFNKALDLFNDLPSMNEQDPKLVSTALKTDPKVGLTHFFNLNDFICTNVRLKLGQGVIGYAKDNFKDANINDQVKSALIKAVLKTKLPTIANSHIDSILLDLAAQKAMWKANIEQLSEIKKIVKDIRSKRSVHLNKNKELINKDIYNMTQEQIAGDPVYLEIAKMVSSEIEIALEFQERIYKLATTLK
jgi:hypothetical protein